MKPHETILKMIEEVDPNDTAKLDEIDFDVCMFVYRLKRHTFHPTIKTNDEYKGKFGSSWATDKNGDVIPNSCANHSTWPEFTRSRDASKSIRPRNYVLKNETCTDEWACVELSGVDIEINFKTPVLPNEYLAELHAIIQAIAYERGE